MVFQPFETKVRVFSKSKARACGAYFKSGLPPRVCIGEPLGPTKWVADELTTQANASVFLYHYAFGQHQHPPPRADCFWASCLASVLLLFSARSWCRRPEL